MINVEVGKFTLESLTTGMYSDPRIVYREYIQNSVDSIEQAVEENIISKEASRIDVIVDAEECNITIKDNGKGISSYIAEKILTNIGNSTKRHNSNRGFRGIGRLGGLSYCDELVFITSSLGEDVLTKIVFNCKLLRKLLSPGEYEELNLADVIRKITTVERYGEQKSAHYFIVKMNNVDLSSALLEMDTVKTYISEVAPVSYNPKKFLHANEIKKFLLEHDYELTEFNIYVGYEEEDLKPVYKPNKYRFISDRNKKIEDVIEEVVTFSVDLDDSNSLLGWYARCNWYGTLVESSLRGMRIRKGNILIGDNRTLNSIFKEDRFNGWIQGEIFVKSNELIPNARRDSFEQNEVYYSMIKILREKVAEEITKEIREASKNRNNPNSKILVEVSGIAERVDKLIDEGLYSDKDKEQLEGQLVEAANKLSRVNKNDEKILDKKNEISCKLNDVREKIENTDNFKLKNENLPQIDKKSKKILKITMETLSQYLSREMVEIIYSGIIDKIKKRDV